jgi:serine/threonine-protein kinase
MESSQTPVPLNPGDIVAHYRVERLIGRGGMGTVYEVSHVRVAAKRFAMKVLSTEVVGHPDAESRFMREAEAASRLNHPHVVNMVDFGRDRGITYLAMELLEGEDLSALIARRKLSFERVADIMLAVCSGVGAAHQLGIIHRDLKPGNIFLSRTHMGDTVPKVLDFGISKLRIPGDNKLTQRFSLIGTPNYVSPEQAEGRPVDCRCDIYALGTILYECVTGRRCHEGSSLYSILRSIAEADYPRPSALRPDLPPEFEAVIMKSLEHNPDARFATVRDMGCALVPHGSEKRRQFWTDYYLGSEGDALASSNFSVVPISLSKYAAPALPKTKLLPVEKARQIQQNPAPEGKWPPVPASVPESSRPDRAAGLRGPKRQEYRPSKSPTQARKTGRLPWFIVIGGLLGAAVLGGFLLHHGRSSVGAAGPSQPATQSQPPPNAMAATPVQAEAPREGAQPMLPREANVASPSGPASESTDKAMSTTTVSKRRATSERPRQGRAGTLEHVRRVKRNSNGIPLLKP